MAIGQRKEIEKLIQCLRAYGPATFHNLITALVTWLFGVLVFMPVAYSLDLQTGQIVTLIVFMMFTVFIFRAIPSFRKLIDAFAFFPARKYGSKKGMAYADALTLFKYTFYVIFALVVYALYFPFLTSFHLAISGITLIVVLVWIFFLALRILSILSSRVLAKS